MIARCLRWCQALVVLGLPGLVGVAAGPPVASAAGPLNVVWMACSSSGGGSFSCEAEVAGGTPVYRFSWAGLSNARVGSQSTSGSYSSITGTCTINYPSTVKLVVTDSTGQTLSAQRSFQCYPHAP